MIFRPELAQAVMEGRKTVTRRLVSSNPRSPWWRERCALVVGRDYAVCPGRGKPAIGRVRIVSVTQCHLGHGLAEARLEGFASEMEFRAAWEAINGSYRPDALVWRVEFEVVPHHGYLEPGILYGSSTARCTCGWSGNPCVRRSRALAEMRAHVSVGRTA